MPKALHDKLLREGKAKGLTGKRLEAYAYGALSRIEEEEKKRRRGKK